MQNSTIVRGARPIALFGLLCLLPGCALFETSGKIVLVNDASHQIIVTAGGDTQVAFQGKSIDMPLADELWIETTTCRLYYRMPVDSDDYPWKVRSSSDFAVQVETNYELYAIPLNRRRPYRLTTITQIQRGDFPVKAAAMSCRPSEDDE